MMSSASPSSFEDVEELWSKSISARLFKETKILCGVVNGEETLKEKFLDFYQEKRESAGIEVPLLPAQDADAGGTSKRTLLQDFCKCIIVISFILFSIVLQIWFSSRSKR